MAKEIERRFLLRDDSWKRETTSFHCFRQAYIPVIPGEKHIVVRIRVTDEKAFLTLKGSCVPGSFSKSEFEYPIPPEDACAMLEEFCGNRVEKKRYIVERPPFRWEIDEFHGANAPLCIAEIELPSEETSFPRPAWLGREVTDDHKYSNSFLALHPYASWEKQDRERDTQ